MCRFSLRFLFEKRGQTFGSLHADVILERFKPLDRGEVFRVSELSGEEIGNEDEADVDVEFSAGKLSGNLFQLLTTSAVKLGRFLRRAFVGEKFGKRGVEFVGED